MPTKLLYIVHMGQLKASANLLEIRTLDDGRLAMVLDQTIFYPQGGGQPYDTGKVTTSTAEFLVTDVRFLDGVVLHIGQFSHGEFEASTEVNLEVDSERRMLHRRLHSAGHVVDMVIATLKPTWTPGKGYHFPDGPYVEYNLADNPLQEGEGESLKRELEAKVNDITNQSLATEIKFVSGDELANLVRHVPENLPKDKQLRVIMYGPFAVPCGGTHVDNLQDIGHTGIRKIKPEKGNIKVSYQL